MSRTGRGAALSLLRGGDTLPHQNFVINLFTRVAVAVGAEEF